jgi:hypothetical protein
MQSIKYKILSKIYGKGRGWAFSQNDFALLGSRSVIDISLYRLVKKRTIRRVIRGIYDYPPYSKKLKQQLSPDIDKVAQAIARKFGWSIQPSGPAALNIIGLSTQVPGKYLYLSDGPNRTYTIGKTGLVFRKAPSKETGFKRHESAIIVQALKSLGKEGISSKVVDTIRGWLDPKLRAKLLKDTATVTGWVYEAIREICLENTNG